MSDIVDRMQKRVETINRVGGDLVAKGMFIEAITEITRLREELRWIPVTEQLPPQGADVDFLCNGGYDGYGHMYRSSEEWYEKHNLPYPTPKMKQYEGGPYHIGKDNFGNWEVTHWRLRPGTQPDVDKFIEENG